MMAPPQDVRRAETRRIANARGIEILEVPGGHRVVGRGIDFLVCDLYWVEARDLDPLTACWFVVSPQRK